ncbi:MAG: hypothetical protein RBS56_05605 [Candidatus Gracilibacteria bacterium]|jgi:hypothetical protein|nr:hypothetical protein [Candidatus Gracilibacteria bacterium]
MKILKSLVILFLFLNLGLTAYSSGVLTPEERLLQIGGGGENGISSFNYGQHPDSPADFEYQGVGTLSSPIYFAIDLIRYLTSGIALLVVIFMAVKTVVSSSEEDYKTAKTGIFMGIGGFFLIQIADFVVKKIFFGEFGEAFEDSISAKEYATEGASFIRGIIGWVNLFLGTLIVFVIILKGFKLVSSPGSDEELTSTKNHLIYAIIGLILVALSEVIIRGFIFPDAGASLPDAKVGKSIIVLITNYLSGFIGFIAFVMLFYAGYLYVVQQGSDAAQSRVKNTIFASVIAILLSFAAFAIVNTFINIDSAPANTQTTQQITSP